MLVLEDREAPAGSGLEGLRHLRASLPPGDEKYRATGVPEHLTAAVPWVWGGNWPPTSSRGWERREPLPAQEWTRAYTAPFSLSFPPSAFLQQRGWPFQSRGGAWPRAGKRVGGKCGRVGAWKSRCVLSQCCVNSPRSRLGTGSPSAKLWLASSYWAAHCPVTPVPLLLCRSH